MEQAGRALSSLIRALRELNALLAEHVALAAEQEPPRDMDEFRAMLTRRIEEIVAATPETGGEAKPAET